jgi:hypothetical protein
MKNLTPIARAANMILVIAMISVIPTLMGSCSNSSFSGTSKVRRPILTNGGNGTYSTGGGSTAGGSGGVTSGTDLNRNASVINGAVCVNEIPAVDIAMVIDRSSTMKDEVQAVHDGISAFSIAMQSKILPGFNKPISKLRFTLIAYEDEKDRRGCPWFVGGPWAAGDPQLRIAIDREFARENSGGSDIPEGGIMAVREAMQIFEAQPEDSVKVIVLVTDTYMHDGTGSQDSRYGGFSTLDSLFASPKMKPFMLFSSSSTSNNGGGDFVKDRQNPPTGPETTYGGNKGKGTAQIQALRDYYKAKANVPNAYVGEEFVSVNNFSKDSLSDLVAQKIADGIKKCP